MRQRAAPGRRGRRGRLAMAATKLPVTPSTTRSAPPPTTPSTTRPSMPPVDRRPRSARSGECGMFR
eukprot:9264249-Alexandrium_andersonii.AAC.1